MLCHVFPAFVLHVPSFVLAFSRIVLVCLHFSCILPAVSCAVPAFLLRVRAFSCMFPVFVLHVPALLMPFPKCSCIILQILVFSCICMHSCCLFIPFPAFFMYCYVFPNCFLHSLMLFLCLSNAVACLCHSFVMHLSCLVDMFSCLFLPFSILVMFFMPKA